MTRKIAAILLALALTFSAAELLIRFSEPYLNDYDMEMWKYALKLKERSSNSLLNHVHRRNASEKLMNVEISINSKRIRDNEFDYRKPKKTYRILALGDSLTLGWGVPFEHIYTKTLERKLNENLNNKPHYEVINAGTGNWNTVQEVQYFKTEGHKYKPDLIILQFFLNDAEPILKSQINESSLLNRSHLVVYMYSRWLKIKSHWNAKEHYQNYYSNLYRQDGWNQSKKAIKSLAEFSQKKNIKMILVLFPDFHELSSTDYPFKDIHKQIKNEAIKNQIEFIDLLGLFHDMNPADLIVSHQDYHPNGRANQMTANYLFDRIHEII